MILARPWRIEYEGAYYHVLSRGKGRRDIFIEDKDRKLFLAPGHRVRGEAKRRIGSLWCMSCGKWDYSGMRK
jgi:hypothetical protein